MNQISTFKIDSFRGIRNLSIQPLKQVNLIVGDNNCGKTSLLEAIQLLRVPGSLANIYKVAKLRDSNLSSNSISIYDNFICMFPKDQETLVIRLSCEYNEKLLSYTLTGKQSRELLDAGELTSAARRNFEGMNGENETDVFDGQSTCIVNGKTSIENIHINRLSRITGTKLNSDELIKISYVSPFEHLKGSTIDKIIRNDNYKKICLKALQLFDIDIEDMMLFKSDIGNSPVEYLKHKRLGNMPLSTYGDGIKKVLVLSNAIIGAANGILLIDEIETAIHKKYYDDIFRFIVKACKAFNVQAFVTTHSIEAIDGLLATQDYDTQVRDDAIMVVTLKRENNKTYSRVLSGREVFKNRESFGFEVRL